MSHLICGGNVVLGVVARSGGGSYRVHWLTNVGRVSALSGVGSSVLGVLSRNRQGGGLHNAHGLGDVLLRVGDGDRLLGGRRVRRLLGWRVCAVLLSLGSRRDLTHLHEGREGGRCASCMLVSFSSSSTFMCVWHVLARSSPPHITIQTMSLAWSMSIHVYLCMYVAKQRLRNITCNISKHVVTWILILKLNIFRLRCATIALIKYIQHVKGCHAHTGAHRQMNEEARRIEDPHVYAQTRAARAQTHKWNIQEYSSPWSATRRRYVQHTHTHTHTHMEEGRHLLLCLHLDEQGIYSTHIHK